MTSKEIQKTQWEEGIKLRGVRKAINTRSLYFNKLVHWKAKIDELPAEDPAPDTLMLFNELRDKITRDLSLYSNENDFMYLELVPKYELIASNEYYVADQVSFNTCIENVEKSIRDYTTILTNAGLIIDASIFSSDPNLIKVLGELVKGREQTNTMFQKQHAQNISINDQMTQAQTQMTTAIEKLSVASTSLKIDQPLFKPVGSYEDFMKWKEWKRHFDIFIKRIADDKWDEKLNWLKASVFGQAANLIFACASTEAGYEEAIRLLKEKYENVDLVREAY